MLSEQCGWGVEKSLINLLNNIDNSKFEVTLVITSNEISLIDEINSKYKIIIIDRTDERYKFGFLYGLGQRCDNPSIIHRLVLWVRPVFQWVENYLYIKYIKKVMSSYHFDTCVIYDVYVAEISVKAINAKNYIMFYHHGALGNAYHDKIGYKKSNSIVVVSRNLCEKIKKKYPMYAHKMVAIHNIIDAKLIADKSNINVISPFKPDNFNIVSCGRLSYEKGMDIAVKALKRLIEHGYTDIRWYIIGGGREYDNLRKLIEELQLESYIELLGEKENPYPYIKQGDLFVQTNRCEAYGLSLVEALILHVPSIATRTDGAQEILEDGKYGVICDGTPEDVAEKIESIIVHRDYYNRLKKKTFDKNVYKENLANVKKLERLLMKINQ